jgi:hypothetical protein
MITLLVQDYLTDIITKARAAKHWWINLTK